MARSGLGSLVVVGVVAFGLVARLVVGRSCARAPEAPPPAVATIDVSPIPAGPPSPGAEVAQDSVGLPVCVPQDPVMDSRFETRWPPPPATDRPWDWVPVALPTLTFWEPAPGK